MVGWALVTMSLVVATGGTGNAHGQTEVRVDLFSRAQRLPAERTAQDPLATRATWEVRLNASLLQVSEPSSALRLALPGGTIADLDLDYVQNDQFNGQAWIGHVSGTERRAIFMVDGDSVAGHVNLGRASLEIRPRRGRQHAIDLVDTTLLAPEAPPIAVPHRAKGRMSAAEAADNGKVFDVMVLYTKNTVAGAGSNKAIRMLIKLGVTETNVAFADSKVIPRIRLVKLAKDPYKETGDAFTDVERLRTLGDGHWVKVDRLRDRFGADFVVGIVELIGIGGVAFTMNGVSPAFERSAVALVRRPHISPGYTFAHELGHNFGLLHDRANARLASDSRFRGSNRAYSFSYGYADVPGNFRTIMAYAPPEPRILRWANPKKTFNGRPTGIDRRESDSADARISINRARRTLANFRPCTKKCG